MKRPEIVIGLVGALVANLDRVIEAIEKSLAEINYGRNYSAPFRGEPNPRPLPETGRGGSDTDEVTIGLALV